MTTTVQTPVVVLRSAGWSRVSREMNDGVVTMWWQRRRKEVRLTVVLGRTGPTTWTAVVTAPGRDAVTITDLPTLVLAAA